MAKACWNGSVLAESDDTEVVDGNHYFPKDAVVSDHLVESSHRSVCPWKGEARYYHVRVGESVNENAAWSYPETKDTAKSIEGRVAFWNGVEVTD